MVAGGCGFWCLAQDEFKFLDGDMAWSRKYRAYVVEAFIKNGESVTATQRPF